MPTTLQAATPNKANQTLVFLTATKHLEECPLCQVNLHLELPQFQTILTCLHQDPDIRIHLQVSRRTSVIQRFRRELDRAITHWLREHPVILVRYQGQTYRFRDQERALLFVIEQGWHERDITIEPL